MTQYNKAWLAGLGPILLTILLKVDAKILAPVDWSMGTEFWTGVSALIVGVIVAWVPNSRPADAATRSTDPKDTSNQGA